MADEYLVSFDTDHIKDYVFATDKLREVRGASKLLDELNEEEAMQNVIERVCSEFRIVYSAGGSSAVLVPSEEEARQVIREVEAEYRLHTFSASITGAYRPMPVANRERGFGKQMEAVAARLRQNKDEKARRVLATVEPYTQPCASCECYPATRESHLDHQPICESCEAKRQAFKVLTGAHEKLSDIGDVAHPPGYIGFIYADGNNIGERLSQMEQVDQYRDFAKGLNHLIHRTSVYEALNAYPARRGVLPYEPLLIGGDDLMVVVAGDLALPIALEMAKRFEDGAPALLKQVGLSADDPLTLGIGVVLAHDSFPMVAFYRLARELCGSAKRRCAEDNYRHSALDFMVVTAAGSSNVKTLRNEVLTEKAFVFPHSSLYARLTRRPYLIAEANQLIDHARKFKRANFPTSQLHFLYEGLFHSLLEATFRWRKVVTRVKKDHRALLADFHTDFAGEATRPPWHRRTRHDNQTEYVAAFGDLVEIYPFV